MKTRNRTITLLLLLALALTPGLAGAQEVLHGRVSYADEGALVKGTEDEDWSYATTNALVLPGDVLWADEQATMEIEFSGGVFVRMADGSKLDVIAVPPETVLRGDSGSFYIQRVSRSTGSVLFNTPIGGVEIAPDSQVRFDVLSEGPTTITVRWGQATIHADGGTSVVVHQGHRSYIDPGYAPTAPLAFDRSEEDDFDSWNRERARLLALGSESVPIPSTVEAPAPIGVSDLNGQGEWIYVDDNYYWRPTVVTNYVPYRNGYWSYVPSQGYVWIGDYSFAYVTSHYGRWSHHNSHGWIWRYHYGYSPAWVSSIRYGDYYVWSPVDYYGYPVHYGHTSYLAGGLHFSLYASSYVHYSYLHHSYRHVHHLQSHHLGHVDRSNISAWDIHAQRSRYRDGVRHRSDLPGRNFSPRRVMRGPRTLGDRTVNAVDRAGRLQDRTRTARLDRTEIRNTQQRGPAGVQLNRRADTRTVRLNRSTQNTPTRRIQQARNNSDATRRLISRNISNTSTTASNRPTNNTRVRRVGAPTTANTPTRRTVSQPSTTNSSRVRRVGAPSTTTRNQPTQSTRGRREGEPTARTTRRTVTSPSTTNNRRATRAPAPRSPSVNTAPRRVTRTGPTTSSTTRRTTVAPPATRRGGPTVTRTGPSTTSTRRVRTPQSTRMTQPAPSQRQGPPSISRSAPSQRQAPRSVSRSAPSQRQAPRSVSRSAPSQRQAPRSVSRPSPSRSQAPRSVSRSSPSRRQAAPSRSSGRRPSSGRSVRGVR